MTQSEPTTKRELELELQVWQERMNSCSNAAEAIKAQGQLLQLQAREAQQNIARLEAALKAANEAPGNAPEGGGGPGEEQ